MSEEHRTRARALRMLAIGNASVEYVEGVIAQALADARNAALEEAATLCGKGSAYLPTCCSRECYENARVIRALKGGAQGEKASQEHVCPQCFRRINYGESVVVEQGSVMHPGCAGRKSP